MTSKVHSVPYRSYFLISNYYAMVVKAGLEPATDTAYRTLLRLYGVAVRMRVLIFVGKLLR